MNQTSVTVTKEGRVNIPASLRRELGVEAGDSLSARVEDGQLILATEAALLKQLRSLAGPPPKADLASEQLIRERRKEAAEE